MKQPAKQWELNLTDEQIARAMESLRQFGQEPIEQELIEREEGNDDGND